MEGLSAILSAEASAKAEALAKAEVRVKKKNPSERRPSGRRFFFARVWPFFVAVVVVVMPSEVEASRRESVVVRLS